MLANGITDLAPLKGRFEIIVQSGERYPVYFDEAWQWIGYSLKENALRVLLANFDENLDYVCSSKKRSKQMQKNETTSQRGGHNRIDYSLTVDCFKAFCMMAGTERGKEVRKYYLAVEKALAVMVKTGGGLTEAQISRIVMEQNRPLLERLERIEMTWVFLSLRRFVRTKHRKAQKLLWAVQALHIRVIDKTAAPSRLTSYG